MHDTPSSKLIKATRLKDLIDKQRVVVVIGAGGVGKTTTAVAMAMSAAELGRRVALLSIDPAKRLAAALGIPLGHEVVQVQLPEHVKGSLHATMLDQKAVFDNMVRKHAPSARISDKILRDPLYVSASTSLSGPLEYMALARLQELADDPAYDLVVLDTPPDTHALDFLGRPQVLSGFLEAGVASKILKPVAFASKLGLGSALAVGEKLLGGISKVTGFKVLAGFAEFVLLMREVIEGFHKSGERVLELLRRPSSSFILVTVPTEASRRSAVFLMDRLRSMNYELSALVINRCLPEEICSRASQMAEAFTTGRDSDTARTQYFAKRATGEARVVKDLELALREKSPVGALLVRVDELESDLQTVAGLKALSAALNLN